MCLKVESLKRVMSKQLHILHLDSLDSGDVFDLEGGTLSKANKFPNIDQKGGKKNTVIYFKTLNGCIRQRNGRIWYGTRFARGFFNLDPYLLEVRKNEIQTGRVQILNFEVSHAKERLLIMLESSNVAESI